MTAAAPTKPVLFGVYVALMLLLTASAVGAFAPLPPWGKLLLSVGIAAVKTALIFAVFMQLKYQRGLVRVFALAAFFWLAIIGVLTFSDYLTRGLG
jgi:cytochrome c oxidase subunit IV